MRRFWIALSLAGSMGLGLAGEDDFQREGERAFKDKLEGQTPPALTVGPWLNAQAQEVSWEALRGKVVLVEFWGTW